MTAKINMLAIDPAKGSFQVCAVGPEGMVPYNRSLSRTRPVMSDNQVVRRRQASWPVAPAGGRA